MRKMLTLWLILVTMTGAAAADPVPQASAPSSGDIAAPSCTPSRNLTPICGIMGPEDIEPTPDGRHLIVSETGGFIRPLPNRRGLVLVDTETLAHRPLAIDTVPRKGWGDPHCRAPTALAPHGIHLSRRTNGTWQLLVVNHAGREAVEFYELARTGASYALVWHGCVAQPDDLAFNDIAATATGFIGTIPNGRLPANVNKGLPLDGSNTGFLMEWTPRSGFVRLPDSEAAYNNGIEIGRGGRFVYFAAWTGRQLRKYDRLRGKVVAVTALNFLPDNVTVREDGVLVAAGITDLAAVAPCRKNLEIFCPVGARSAAVDPVTMKVKPLFAAPAGTIAGASVALQRRGSLYVGALSGDRIVRVGLGRSSRPADSAAPDRVGGIP